MPAVVIFAWDHASEDAATAAVAHDAVPGPHPERQYLDAEEVSSGMPRWPWARRAARPVGMGGRPVEWARVYTSRGPSQPISCKIEDARCPRDGSLLKIVVKYPNYLRRFARLSSTGGALWWILSF